MIGLAMGKATRLSTDLLAKYHRWGIHGNTILVENGPRETVDSPHLCLFTLRPWGVPPALLADARPYWLLFGCDGSASDVMPRY